MPKPNKKSRRKPPEDELEEEEEHCPHIPLMSMEDKETTKLRFAVGTEVACNTGEDWPEGRVTKQFYTQRSFPPGYCAAYQVEMHDGRLIFAPRDNDHFIGVPAAAKEAEWDAFFSKAVAAGHMSSSEIDSLSDALAELSSAGERRELIDEQIEQAITCVWVYHACSCVRACVRACVCACVRACACVSVCQVKSS